MNSYYQIAVAREFFQQLHNLDRSIFLKWQRIGRMIYKDPFDDSLDTHPVKHAEDGVFAARLDDNYRIIFRHIKPDIVLLFWVDKHDPAYGKAERTSITLEDGKIKILESIEEKTYSSTQQPLYHSQPVGLLFARWNDEKLMELGLSADWLPAFRQMNKIADFDNAIEQIPEKTFNALYDLLIESTDIQGNTVVISDTQLKSAISQPETREDIYVFETGDEFEKALSGTLVEWMLFLHPSQKQLAEANFNGAARIKGGAGTGKTVVALHRTRYLAQTLATNSLNKVLILSFNSRLSVVISELLRRLCNDDEFNHVEVKTLHQWCAWYLKYACHDKPNKAEDSQINASLDNAIRQTQQDFPNSKVFTLSRDFIEDEIRYVIKGRAVSTLDDYLQLKRTGRGTPLGIDERQVIFKIYSRYQQGLGYFCDWDDFILKSLRHAKQGIPTGSYVAVIVDEVQDFTEASMSLINHIGGDKPNSLLLIGDGQQKIYKGGFSLKNVGISIVGRSRILRYNYRNTKQILEAAYSMVKGVSFDDLEDDEDVITASPEFPKRSGIKPILKQSFTTQQDELKWVAEQIRDRVFTRQVNKPGDIGVLYMSGKKYGSPIDRTLSSYGIQITELRRDNASAFFDEGTVKRCTFYSAKGMEFKVIFLVGVTDGTIPSDSALPEEAQEDTERRERRLLFVAMTRARDVLYMSCSEGQPSRFLKDIEQGLIEVL
jgi:superfamily I DNA/RNA helicase/mRNA-degrading endonuclease RelE of RelBE toxin-antitoxin system